MTIADLFDVTPTITALDITARATNTHLLHRWIVSEKADEYQLPPILWRELMADRLTVMPTKINAHNDPIRGMPEMGWGYKAKSIPAEILNAPVTHLSMRCADGITYSVNVDIELDPLTVESLKVTWGNNGESRHD